jgi:hypothetical protein
MGRGRIRVGLLRWAFVLVGLAAAALGGGCTSNAIPGLNTPWLGLNTPAPLPPPPMVIAVRPYRGRL